jgi:hypothetical protein
MTSSATARSNARRFCFVANSLLAITGATRDNRDQERRRWRDDA